MEEVDRGCPMIRMGVSGWMFLLVLAHPGSPAQTAVKQLCVCVCVCIVHRCCGMLLMLYRSTWCATEQQRSARADTEMSWSLSRVKASCLPEASRCTNVELVGRTLRRENAANCCRWSSVVGRSVTLKIKVLDKNVIQTTQHQSVTSVVCIRISWNANF